VDEAGIELTDFIIYNPGQPSYQAELVRVLARNPDAIYLAGGQESGVTVIKEATAGGFSGEWLFTADLAVPEIFDAVGPALLNDRAYVEVADPDKSLPAYKDFAELHAEKHDGAAPGPFAANSYDMVNLVALALEQGDGCTGVTINENIRDVSEGGTQVTSFAEGKEVIADGGDVDYQGAAGPMTFDESGTVAGSYSIKAARDGRWVDEKFIPATAFE
jgi:ABC-type branched-subunit amino acid transport system substrate-binding protein